MKSIPPKDSLLSLYEQENLNLFQIALKHRVRVDTVKSWFKAYGITPNLNPKLTRQERMQLILSLKQQNLTPKQIAKKLNLARETVYRYLSQNKKSVPPVGLLCRNPEAPNIITSSIESAKTDALDAATSQAETFSPPLPGLIARK